MLVSNEKVTMATHLRININTNPMKIDDDIAENYNNILYLLKHTIRFTYRR